MESFNQINCSAEMELLNHSLNVNLNNSTTNCSSGSNDFMVSLPLLVRTFQIISYLAVFIVGLSLSVFLIIFILCHKSLRKQRGFAIALQILLSNVVFSIPLLSISVVVAVEGDWTLGDGACQFIALCNQFSQAMRWLLTPVLVIDRALTINWPFKYEKYGAKVVAILSMVTLGVSLFSSIIPPIIAGNCYGANVALNTCSFDNQGCRAFRVPYATFLLVVGGFLPFFLYIWMLFKAKKGQQQIVPTEGINHTTTEFSVTRKQLLTIFLLFWTLLGCLLPHYVAFIITYFSYNIKVFRLLLRVGFPLLILTQPLYYGLLIADPIAMMWNRDVKQKLKLLKQKVSHPVSEYFTTSNSTTPF